MKTNANPNDSVPDVVAYFEVYVGRRVDGYRAEATEAAQRAVQRYLYQGDVIDIALHAELPRYVLTVRVEWNGSREELERAIAEQRDRLSSGLYGSSAPVFFERAS